MSNILKKGNLWTASWIYKNKSELANIFNYIFHMMNVLCYKSSWNTALYPISHHPQFWNLTHAQKIIDCFCSASPRYKKLIRTSHELFSYFTEIVLSRRNTMESPHSKWGLCDSTVYCVHSTLYFMAPIGEELLTVFAALFRIKPVTSIIGLLWLLIRDPLTEVFYH